MSRGLESLNEQHDDDFGVPAGTLVGGRFRVQRPLTEGGMATVYVAADTQNGDRLCAVKIMAPRLLRDEKSRERFEQEATIGSVLKHPHIVAVLGAGVDAQLESPWIAMELLEGGTIASVLKQRGALPLEEVRLTFLGFGAAMAAAHSRGVVHRDLKPENVFLESKPSEGLPHTLKVLDFGIAKVRKDVTMKNSQLIGSPLWMAPEQLAAGTNLGPFTDVWPFGLLAFFALTGKPYWMVANEPTTNLPKLLAEIMAQDIAPPTERAKQLGITPTWPSAFDAWFLRCVARDPSARFQTVGDAAAELDDVLSGRAPAPVAPRSVPPLDLNEPAVRTTPAEKVHDERAMRETIPTGAFPIDRSMPPPVAATIQKEPAVTATRSRTPYALVAGALVLLALALGAWLRFGS